MRLVTGELVKQAQIDRVRGCLQKFGYPLPERGLETLTQSWQVGLAEEEPRVFARLDLRETRGRRVRRQHNAPGAAGSLVRAGRAVEGPLERAFQNGVGALQVDVVDRRATLDPVVRRDGQGHHQADVVNSGAGVSNLPFVDGAVKRLRLRPDVAPNALVAGRVDVQWLGAATLGLDQGPVQRYHQAADEVRLLGCGSRGSRRQQR